MIPSAPPASCGRKPSLPFGSQHPQAAAVYRLAATDSGGEKMYWSRDGSIKVLHQREGQQLFHHQFPSGTIQFIPFWHNTVQHAKSTQHSIAQHSVAHHIPAIVKLGH